MFFLDLWIKGLDDPTELSRGKLSLFECFELLFVVPFTSQSIEMSLKELDIFIKKSKLGLFLPLNTWETLDLWTPIFVANWDAERSLDSKIYNNLLLKFSMYTFVKIIKFFNNKNEYLTEY